MPEGARAMTWMPDRSVRHEMDETLRAQRTRSTESHYEFDGSTATVVYERWGLYSDWYEHVDVYRICKNLHGEYFLYMHAFQHTPYLAHLTRDRAMNALRVDLAAFQREFGE